jgi:hypothetical protein
LLQLDATLDWLSGGENKLPRAEAERGAGRAPAGEEAARFQGHMFASGAAPPSGGSLRHKRSCMEHVLSLSLSLLSLSLARLLLLNSPAGLRNQQARDHIFVNRNPQPGAFRRAYPAVRVRLDALLHEIVP